jgi:Ca2+-binding RTX toxin-like protein
MTNKKKDLIINYGDGDSVTVKDYYKLNKKGKVTGVNAKNSVKNISFGDESGNETIYLGAGESTVKIDMSMFDGEVQSPGTDWEWTDYKENCVKTIYLNDDPSSTLTLDFDKALFDNGLGVFCRGTGQDRDLYISMSGKAEPGYGIIVKNYFDEGGNPRTNQVKLSLWEYPDTFATERVQSAYTVPDYANADSVPWVRTFDVQPFGAYTGEIRGTNMPHEVLLYSSGFGDDTIYGGNGNIDSIYLHGGNDRVFAGEGEKYLDISGKQTNVEIYLGENAATTTNIHLGLVENNVVSSVDAGSGDLNISWDCYGDTTHDTYTSTLRVDKWNSRTSLATISMSGNNRDNTLRAVDGVANTLDGGDGDDTLIGGTGVDTFNFAYNNAHGVDTIKNYTADDIIRFESKSNAITVDYSKFKFYTTNSAKSLVINTKDLYSEESYVIVDNYFDSNNKIDRIIGYNCSNPNSEASLATLYGNKNDLGSFEIGNGGVFAGTNNQDVFIARSEENTFTGGKGEDLLYASGGDSTFVFNTGDGNDIVYQDGGNVTLKFNNATIEELSSKTGYDKDSVYYDDLLIHYDGTNTLRVKDYYYTSKNKVTKIIDSTGTEYNMSDYFKQVKYVSDFYINSATNKADDIRITANLGYTLVQGKKGSDTIWGSQYDDNLFTYLGNWDLSDFDKTAGVVDTIHGGAGDDYLIGQSSTNLLYGDEGNDMFIAFVNEGLNTTISDSSGTQDALNIYDETCDNIHFVFNADSDGNIDNNGLRILNNENFNLWKANVNDENIKGINIVNNWNCIENYEEAGDDNGCSHLTVATLETLKNDVVSWLTSGGRDYGSVSEALTSGNNEDITALIAKFNISDQWVYQEY